MGAEDRRRRKNNKKNSVNKQTFKTVGKPIKN